MKSEITLDQATDQQLHHEWTLAMVEQQEETPDPNEEEYSNDEWALLNYQISDKNIFSSILKETLKKNSFYFFKNSLEKMYLFFPKGINEKFDPIDSTISNQDEALEVLKFATENY